jgi:hypothetical protein
MTAQELLAQLRDIHVPADPGAATDTGFALWPVIVFVVLLAALLMAGYRRRTAWRRQAGAALKIIEAEPDPARRWSALLRLAMQIARHCGRTDTIPQAVYRNPAAVTDADAAALCRYLREQLKINR